MKHKPPPDLPTIIFNESTRRLTIFQYVIQDIKGIIAKYNPRQVVALGNHKNISLISEWKELTHIDIRNTKHRNFDFIANLKIENLTLNCVGIEDISFAMQMNDLKYLSLWKNTRLKDLSMLEGNRSVSHLSLYGFHKTKYPDFKLLENLTHLTLDCCSEIIKSAIPDSSADFKLVERNVKYATAINK
jgi:hypothetical protein